MSFNEFASTFASIPVLTNSEIVQLHNSYLSGNINAFDRLIESNMRLVLKIANDYKNYGMELEDVVSNGTIGLMKAIEHFNSTKGEFSPYASMYIKKYIRVALNQHKTTIRMKRYDRMTQEERSNAFVESLNDKIGDGETEFADTLTDNTTLDEQLMREENGEMLMKAINALEERERYVVVKHNNLDGNMTLEQIANQLNCSTERVRQIEVKAFAKIRNYLSK